MKVINKILKSSLLVLTITMLTFSLSMLLCGASDEFNSIISYENGTITLPASYEKSFTLENLSQLKISFEGNGTNGFTWGGYIIEIKDSNNEIVYSIIDESEYDDKEYLTDILAQGDYTFCLYSDIYYDIELMYCVSLSYKIAEVESVNIDKTSLYLCKGDTSTLHAEYTPSIVESKIKWSSSDKNVVTVSSDGFVKAIAPGKAVITAKAGGKKETCKVTVFSTSGKSYKTIVSTQTGTIAAGKTKKNNFTLKTYSKIKISFTRFDYDTNKGTNGEYEFKIKNSAGDVVYTDTGNCEYVDESYTTPVLPKDTYTFILTPYKKSTSSTPKKLDYMYKISYISLPDTSVKNIKLSASEVTLAKGKTKTLEATLSPSYLTNTVTWSSSNKNVATVSSSGKITAKALGSATITAKIGNKKATCKVKVTSMSATVVKKKSTKLSAYIKNISSYKNAKWNSSNTSIATVDKTGKVIGKAYGKCNIYCTIKGTKYVFNISVKTAVTATPSYISEANIYNDAGIKFTNNSNLDITYVTLKIYQYDNRGYKISSPYSSYYINDTIKAKSSETYEFWVNDSTKKITCSITKVWFSDGSTWTP